MKLSIHNVREAKDKEISLILGEAAKMKTKMASDDRRKITGRRSGGKKAQASIIKRSCIKIE